MEDTQLSLPHTRKLSIRKQNKTKQFYFLTWTEEGALVNHPKAAK